MTSSGFKVVSIDRSCFQIHTESFIKTYLFGLIFNNWFFELIYIFVGHCCPPGSGSGFRICIRIHWPEWIRIQSGSGSETLAESGVYPKKGNFDMISCFKPKNLVYLDAMKRRNSNSARTVNCVCGRLHWWKSPLLKIIKSTTHKKAFILPESFPCCSRKTWKEFKLKS